MSHRVIISRQAERDMLAIARWWAGERSDEQASRWLAGLDSRLRSLTAAPERFPLAPEHQQFSYEFRELHYGLGSQATHRAVFTVASDLVLVLAVRHLAQDWLRPKDLL